MFYGYGPHNEKYPTIVGFDSLENAVDTATAFFNRGVEWSKKDKKYIPVPDGTKRIARVYQFETPNDVIFMGEVVSKTGEKATGVTLTKWHPVTRNYREW